ncbi:DUF2306 domain-containing protein [Thermobifida alba]
MDMPVEHGPNTMDPARGLGETARGGRPSWWRRPWVIPLVAVVLAFLVYSLPPYLTLDPEKSAVPLREGTVLHYPLLVLHIATGTVAMLTMCLQLWPWLRRRHPRVHRVSGRVHVIAGAVPGALLALVLVPYAFPGQPVGAVGNTLSSLLWLAAVVAGVRAARRRRFAEHRRWMVYGFALMMNIVWGRVIPFLALIPGVEISDQFVKEWSGWLGTAVNLLVAHWWLSRASKRAVAPAPAGDQVSSAVGVR